MTGIYMNRDRLKEDIKAAEGCVLHAYEDHLGYLTIGFGRLIDERKGGGISQAEADLLLENDIDRVTKEVGHAIPWFRYAPDPIQRALVEMAFQMGVQGLLGFKKMLDAINRQDYPRAALEAVSSVWATQTPERARKIAAQIRKA